jgi:hypothetical protein
MNDAGRFVATASQILGRRLTYDQLTSSYEDYYQQMMP